MFIHTILEDHMTTVPATRSPRLGSNWSVTVETIKFCGGKGPNRIGEATLFRIFLTVGGILEAGTWVLPTGLGVPFCEVDPAPVSDELRSIIASQRGNLIAGKVYIGVMPHTALFLALAGIITQKVLEGAVETSSKTIVMVTLDDVDCEIRISPKLPHNIAAYNTDGEVV
jgi:hypothetical protein